MTKYFLSALFVTLSFFCFSQEALKPLNNNINYHYAGLNSSINAPPAINLNQHKTQSSLQLPFLDDFYYANTLNYPKQDLWSDSMVYINTGFPIAPLSIGVATFDGLNKFGYPYTPNIPNLNLSYPADTLTSKAINLHMLGAQVLLPSDSVALSFYYQAGGNGEFPEPTDSLILDFYNPIKQKWDTTVWYKKGPLNANNADTIFRRVFIPIKDTNYLQDGFKFRFRNWATRAGNFDHWHIDYVYINKNRSALSDTVYNDINFTNVPSSFLNAYAAMPFEQYMASDMAKKNSVRIRNNGVTTTNMTYENKFYDETGAFLHAYSGGADNLQPFRTAGYSSITAHANPTFNYTFAPMQDSADFMIKHYLYRSSGPSSDFILSNDTVLQYQRFRNYYAYDDGGAESGYYINGAGAKIALKFTINVSDSLRGVRIYFDNDGFSTLAQTSYKFRICIWAAGSNGPGSLLFRDSTNLPIYYKNGYNLFPEYNLTTPRGLSPGTYYIGIQQAVASGIAIGFDKNSDYHNNLYYSYGNNTVTQWTQSEQKGALMLRPVFGKKIPHPLTVRENFLNKPEEFMVYPNPSSDYFVIQSVDMSNTAYQLFNAMGQTITEESITFKITDEQKDNFIVDTHALSNGVYFLILKKNNNIVQQHKIIIQH